MLCDLSYASLTKKKQFLPTFVWFLSVNLDEFRVHVDNLKKKQKKNHGKIEKKFISLFVNDFIE